MSDILKNMDWSPILGLLGTIITGLLGWLASSVKKRNEQAAAESRAAVAGLKLAAIGVALLQKGWAKLSPKIQAALADGQFSPAERAEIEAMLPELLKEVTDEATLKEISEALGLPLPGILAKLASTLIEKWTQAHDPAVSAASAKTFPVTPDDGWPTG